MLFAPLLLASCSGTPATENLKVWELPPCEEICQLWGSRNPNTRLGTDILPQNVLSPDWTTAREDKTMFCFTLEDILQQQHQVLVVHTHFSGRRCCLPPVSCPIDQQKQSTDHISVIDWHHSLFRKPWGNAVLGTNNFTKYLLFARRPTGHISQQRKGKMLSHLCEVAESPGVLAPWVNQLTKQFI